MDFDQFWNTLSEGQRAAIGRKVARAKTGDETQAEQIIRDVLADNLRITLVDATRKFVDDNGRVIPTEVGVKSVYVNANRTFFVNPHSTVDYGSVRKRYVKFAPGLKWPTTKDFKRKANEIIQSIWDNRQTANLLRGCPLPICLPAMKVGDYGQTLEQVFLPAVKRSYEDKFPGRTFYNHRAGTLEGQTTVVPESRHQALLDMMAEGPVVAVYFPTALQGFSISADREAIQTFPKNYVLNGGFDTACAMIAYPGTLARDCKTPAYDCLGLQWRGLERSFCFHLRGTNLDFDDGYPFAVGGCSGGVVVLWQS